MPYLRVPIETDPSTLMQDVFNYIIGLAPQWVANDNNLDVWIIQVFSSIAAESRDLASDVLDTIFRYFGSSLMGIPPVDAVAASAQTTWTMIDNNGYTIPSGTLVGISDGAGNIIPFATISDIIIPPGTNVTGPGAVSIVAITPGVAATNLGIAGQVIQLIDILDFVDTVVLTGPTAGGVDAETDEDYLNRLVVRMRRLSQRPILPIDFAEMAKDADPGIYRAVAIDGYNPVDGTYNNDRMVTVASIDIDGNQATALMKANVDALLQANREVNFIVNEMDPNYNTVDVTTEVAVLPGYDPAATIAAVTTEIQTYLSPAIWGRDPLYTDVNANQTWVDRQTVYYNDLLADIDRIEGVDRVVDLQIAIQGNALGRVDVPLVAPATLTRPGNIVVTAS